MSVTKNFNKLWDALYVLMACFRKDLGEKACKSLETFFKSLTVLLPFYQMREMLKIFMEEYPIEKNICSCLKHVRWTVELHNFMCKHLNINRQDDFDQICKVYDVDKIDKTFWGNRVWFFIHYIALHQPKKIPDNVGYAFKKMMESLSYLLPCSICREHLKNHLLSFPIDSYLDTNESLFEWTVILHNKVNVSLKKKTMTVKDAKPLYQN